MMESQDVPHFTRARDCRVSAKPLRHMTIHLDLSQKITPSYSLSTDYDWHHPTNKVTLT